MVDHRDAQRRIWTIGDYPAVARRLLPISVETVESLPITAGTRVLDVGAGDGNFALEAARRGALVVGIDLAPAQIERAAARAEADGLDVDLRVGDAEALEVDDGSFDVVASVLGMIFAPDHERAATEMVRACRPGGTVAAVSWSGGGWSQLWRRRAATVVPPPPEDGPRPELWGDEAEARRRWEQAGLHDVRVERRPFEWHFADVAEAADFFVSFSGPFITFLERAGSLGVADKARAVLVQALEEAVVSSDGAVTLSQPFLLATGTAAPPADEPLRSAE